MATRRERGRGSQSPPADLPLAADGATHRRVTMPRVTKLRPSRRRPGWTEVFLDGVFSCRLPADRVREAGLEEGLVLDPQAETALIGRSERSAATDRALRYLAGGPRSRFQLERYLRRKRFTEPAVREAVERCLELDYLNDRKFAAAFARDRIRLGPRSVALLEAELGERGVDRADAQAGVAEALDGEGVTDEDLLHRAAEKGWRRLRTVEPEAARRRLLAYLARRGFRSADIRRVVERLTPTDGEAMESLGGTTHIHRARRPSKGERDDRPGGGHRSP